eukprot:Cvel_28128.t1-p1 / transcript=Cvel_28128.t1 / gene=Cvel_28128 / organism=Chromera_velia_CCMP2878 / gene_product=Nicotinate phosphoribosyltransferase, putative / transcript_product=Nicotinate phosphoribosyltransferase, putative / location=Cvel_scaffold3628:6805-14900(+) / protein_length=493 / sequence_SO=supercontig / SO=protein_coding / is_pseudo=false
MVDKIDTKRVPKLVNGSQVSTPTLVWKQAPKVPQLDDAVGLPFSEAAESTLTDLYQLSMVYAYWKAGKHQQQSCFDLYFRKCPFHGEFTIFAGIEESLRFINTFHFTDEQISYIKTQFKDAEEDFFNYLGGLDTREVRVWGVQEGTVVFPRYPLLRIEGPLAVVQLLETSLLNLVNFPSLVATNAARHRLAAGAEKKLLEFGLRRAQGPDGAMTASRYSYLGGFDGTSNVRAGHLFGIPIHGTHAHAFVTSFSSLKELKTRALGKNPDFLSDVLDARSKLPFGEEATMNEGELAAFVSYAQSFPETCLCLVDTYDTLKSGVPNFIAVAVALFNSGYQPKGIRLDSGDLAYLSKEARKQFYAAEAKFGVPVSKCMIVASNDLNEAVIHALNDQGHEVDCFGIGTNLVTCQAQPALGMVFKLAELDGRPCMKLSQEMEKSSVPCRKMVYRLLNANNEFLLDLIQKADDEPPKSGQRIFCRHLFDERKRCYVVASK